ncbi:MAG: hypothetical protein ABWY64_09385 [Tardiphaga sp.]
MKKAKAKRPIDIPKWIAEQVEQVMAVVNERRREAEARLKRVKRRAK